ncbi:hypothetical protein GA0070616_0047 [Micromonospora nigra]|uniref:SpoVT-AbrB domain-containing protein n=1 Tax=Micromonospora nigra TaxID=145857 RepID=A0A1C6R791_9ACTN|nr:hypothetical protein [Micromonospora nigra]SCL12871.1 hypothetical protein GA0070616_0047 [Micromonospora nigra]
MKLVASTGTVARPSTVDYRRRFTLPTTLADAAGITPGPVVVLRGERPGELLVTTPGAALARVRAALAATVAAHGVHGSLRAALVDGLGRAAHGPAAGVPVDLPAEGWIVCDAAPLVALLDGDPDAEALVPLLPRTVITDAAENDLFMVLLAAGLAAADTIGGQIDGHEQVMDVLTALGLRTAGLDTEWAPVRTREFALRTADAGLTDAERATIALAAHLGVPALLGRPVGELPGAAGGVSLVDYRDLAPTPATDTPAVVTPA